MKNTPDIHQHAILMKKITWVFPAIAFFLLFLLFPIHCFGGDDWWEGVCQKAEQIQLPAKDRPDAETAKSLNGCKSENFYYGFDNTPDPVKARYCAYLEMDKEDSFVFGGPATLMMIYANGNGVKKNVDIAIKLACKLEGAPAEMEYRIRHLQALKSSKGGKPFDLCDDITSGFMQGHCASRDQKFTDAKLKRNLDGILVNWSEKDKQEFDILKQSFGKFSEARIRNEVDTTGTARAALQIKEESTLSKDFVASVVQFENGKLPRYTQADFIKADRNLNSTYGKIQSEKDFHWGSVKQADIKHTQRVWLKYREAWVTFGRQKYPQVNEDSWRLWLTRKRIAMLKEFLN